MATSLGAQLRQLAIAQGRDGDAAADLRTKPSLIFSPSEAADIDLLTIHGMARAGLEELSEMDARFEPFKKTLFNQESTQIDRELQTKEFNDKLNISLSNYLHLLSGYLLLPPSHQTLEYLIRRYKIHVYNVEDLCTSIIPYHETSIFVRIVQILHLKKTWAFLVGVKNSGAAPPRAVLVQQCIQDTSLLEAICGAASISSNASSKSRAITSFAAVILMETLAAVPSVSNEIVTRMLPFILQSFDKGVSEDHRVGALMVVGALVGKTALSVPLIDTIFNSMAKSFQHDVNELDGVSRIRLPLMVMVQITQTQKLENFPLKAFKFLVKVRELPSLLTEFSKNFNTKNFLSLFLDTLTEHSVIHQHYEEVFVNIIRTVPMENHIELILSRLMRLALRKEAGEANRLEAIKTGDESKDVIKRLLLLVKSHFPGQLGKAINSLLKEDAGKNGIINDEAIAYLREVFSQSLLMPIAESRTTLLLAIDHVEPWIREKALRQLSEFVKIPSASQNTEGALLLRDIFLRRLYDDDLNVVRTVLNVQGLVKLFMPELIFKALVSIISRCAKVDETGGKSTKQNAKVVAKLAFEVLSSHFLDAYPNYLEEVTSIVLGHLLVSAKSWRLNLFVFKQAIKLPVPLFSSLAEIEDDLLDRKGMIPSKDGKQAWLSTVNTKIMLALSTHLLENTANCFSVFRKAIAARNEAKALSLLVVFQILKRRLGVDMKFVQECLQFLREEWESSEAEAHHLVPKLQKVDYNVEFPTPDLYDRLESGHTHAHMEILLHDFLMLLAYIKEAEQNTASHEVLSELFVLFASSTHRHLFKSHTKELLRCVSSTWIVFLTQFFIAGSGVPTAVQVYSLDVYASQFLSIANSYAFGSVVEDEIQTSNLDMQLESCLPSLLVALGSPLKAVRQSAAECLMQLHGLWMVHEISSAKNGSKQLSASILSSGIFQEFLEALADCKDNFVSDGNYMEAFFTMTFCPSGESMSEQKFTSKSSKAIMSYLLHHIFLLPPHAQRVLLVALRGTGYTDEKYLATHKLLHQLLSKRQEHIRQSANNNDTHISQMEVLLLDVLLKVNLSHVSTMLKRGRSVSREAQIHYLSAFFNAIDVEGGPIADPAVVQPCLLSLKFLTSDLFTVLHTSIQDDVFQMLISLSMNKDEAIRLAAQEVLQQLDIPSTAIARHISLAYVKDAELESGKKKKRKTGKGVAEDRSMNIARRWPPQGKELNSVTALLEFLLSTPNIADREKLWGPLFGLLNSILEKEWLKEVLSSSEECHLVPVDEEKKVSLTKSSKGTYVLHLLLIILEKLASSALAEPSSLKEEISNEFDVDAVVTCIKMATDGVTRNHALALLTVAGKLFPERVLNHVLDVLSVVGISTIAQDDSHSQKVTQEMFAAVIPSWLSSNRDPGELLQTFSLSLSKVSLHRRMPLAVNLIRVLGEETGLHLLIYHLLQQYLKGSDFPHDRENGASLTHLDNRLLDSRDWRIVFSQQLCRQYPSHIRLQALVELLDVLQLKLKMQEGTKVTSKTGSTELWVLQQLVANFVGAEIQNREQHIHENVDNEETIQKAFIALMEQTLSQLHLLGVYPDDSFAPSRKVRKDSQNAAYFLLDSITKIMSLPSFCRAIALLLKHKDSKIRRKVLQLYIAKMKERDGLVSASKEKARPLHDGASFGDADLHVQIIDQIVDVLTHTMDDQSLSIKQAAVLALDLSAKLFAGTMPLTFISCLPVLTANLKSQSKSLVAGSLRCAASILSELGPQGLPVLPEFMADLLQFAPKVFVLSKAESNKGTVEMAYESPEVPSALLSALRVLLEKLGSFLSPYLEEIIRLVVLQPHLGSNIQEIQHLLPEKIPARLLLDPLISNYKVAIESGPESTCVIFQMLAQMASKLDRASVVSYHGKIFEFCLTVFDIRRRPPKAITSVSLVEKDAIAAFVALVMKLSETTFKPLFVTMIEWAETQIFDGEPIGRNVHRNIVFYKLVNQLEEKLRSVFVPYFQYLIDSCVSYLTSSHTKSGVASSSKKKRKVENARDLENSDKQTDVDLSMWHLRALVISALHKCFLFDTIGFLDASKFQLLLEPIVSQMVLEGPNDSLLAESTDIPTVSEVDDLLVMCLGQMALTAGTDALWKPLNHEVLMCTRNENIRARRLGLEVVKFMVERLKEEYLVLLPETIPFLAELLEDEDLSIIAKTQEVVKILEELSGESISQYL